MQSRLPGAQAGRPGLCKGCSRRSPPPNLAAWICCLLRGAVRHGLSSQLPPPRGAPCRAPQEFNFYTALIQSQLAYALSYASVSLPAGCSAVDANGQCTACSSGYYRTLVSSHAACRAGHRGLLTRPLALLGCEPRVERVHEHVGKL